MNTNPVLITPSGRPLNVDDLVNGAVPIELVHFPENPISSKYCKCPDVTTSRAEIVTDVGVSTMLVVHLKDGQKSIVMRTNEAVTMPDAYCIYSKPDGSTTFTCIYEFQGSMWLASLSDQKGFINAFTEKDDAGDTYATPLGIDLIMRSALFSDTESIKLIPKGGKGDFTTGKKIYRLTGFPSFVTVVHIRTPGGDDWWESPGGFIPQELRTYNPALGY